MKFVVVMIWLWSNTSRSQFIKLITLCLYRWGADTQHDKGKFTLPFPSLIEVNSKNWNLCSCGISVQFDSTVIKPASQF